MRNQRDSTKLAVYRTSIIRTPATWTVYQTPIKRTVYQTPVKRTVYQTPVTRTVYQTPIVRTVPYETDRERSSVWTAMNLASTSFDSVTAFCQEISSKYVSPLARKAVDSVSDFAYEDMDYESGCDKYDYGSAVFAGIVTGLIDSFFVGSPLCSTLGGVTDKAIDGVVLKFAQWVYRLDGQKGKLYRKAPDSLASAIGFLEDRFRVNYDARYGKDLQGGDALSHFCPGNHHLKSLAHCPDILGLFFSVLDQLTGKTSIVNRGKLVRLPSVTSSAVPGNMSFESKVISGVVNWFGHIMSDVAGSSGTRGHAGKRGSGIPIPGFELFQFTGKDLGTELNGLARFTDLMFQNGYDFRFGLAMSIPVAINQMFTTLLWALRKRYALQWDWKEIISQRKQDPQLARMQLVSAGCFLLVDIGDAALRSQGQLLVFALHLNYVGICKFAFAAYQELCLRFGHAWSMTGMEREWNSILAS